MAKKLAKGTMKTEGGQEHTFYAAGDTPEEAMDNVVQFVGGVALATDDVKSLEFEKLDK